MRPETRGSGIAPGLNHKLSTRAYEYRILDSQSEELMVYHWQPNSIGGGPRFPHLHISAALSARTLAAYMT
jgi:hypothetical protein